MFSPKLRVNEGLWTRSQNAERYLPLLCAMLAKPPNQTLWLRVLRQRSKVKGSQPRHEPHGSALNVVTLMQIDAESARLTSEHEHCI